MILRGERAIQSIYWTLLPPIIHHGKFGLVNQQAKKGQQRVLNTALLKLGMAIGWLRLVIFWLGLNGIELGYKSNTNQQKHTKINNIVLGRV